MRGLQTMVRRFAGLWLAIHLFALLGCEPMGGWQEHEVRPPRPISRQTPTQPASAPMKPTSAPAPEKTSAPSPSPAPAAPEPPPPAGAPTASPAPPPDTPPVETPPFYQLVLINEASPGANVPGITELALHEATAQAAGAMLTMLYVPTGPTGTIHRYTLIYPTRVECAAAASLAPALDVPEVADSSPPPSANAAIAFARGLGLIYATPRGHAEEATRLAEAHKNLQQVLHAADQPIRRRWAAGMIAGGTQIDRFEGYAEALDCFRTAGDLMAPRSLEQMTAVYMQARAQVQLGKPGEARKGLRQLIDTFGAFKETEAYRRASTLWIELGR